MNLNYDDAKSIHDWEPREQNCAVLMGEMTISPLSITVTLANCKSLWDVCKRGELWWSTSSRSKCTSWLVSWWTHASLQTFNLPDLKLQYNKDKLAGECELFAENWGREIVKKEIIKHVVHIYVSNTIHNQKVTGLHKPDPDPARHAMLCCILHKSRDRAI